MARYRLDLAAMPLGAGLPAGMAHGGAGAAYEVVDKPGSTLGRALRVVGAAGDATQTLWAALGDVQHGELYARVTRSGSEGFEAAAGGGWGAVTNLSGPKYTLFMPGAVLRVDPDNPQDSLDYLLSDDNRYSGAGTYEFVVRVDAGRARMAMWRPADAGMPWDTWLYDLADGNPNAQPAGSWGLLTIGSADVEYLAVGTDGNDAPRPGASLDAPRRPEPAAGALGGVVTLSGSYGSPVAAAQNAVRYRVAVSSPEHGSGDRFLYQGGVEVLDTGWLEGAAMAPHAWAGGDPALEYALEVTVRDAALRESAPAMLLWFGVGERAWRSEEGLYGFDMYGHRPQGCTEHVPPEGGGGLYGAGVTVRGLPEGYAIGIERAGGVLYPVQVNPYNNQEVPTAAPANAEGVAVVPLPLDADALLVYGRRLRASGNAAVQHLDLESYRELLGTYVPEHGLLPGDEFTWTVPEGPEAAGASVLTPTPTGVRLWLGAGAYVATASHAATRWRLWDNFRACPTLLYDSGWSSDLAEHLVPLESLPAGWPVLITATFKDSLGLLSPASAPQAYVVPWALPHAGSGRGLRQLRADFEGAGVVLEGTTLAGRPDAITEDYLTAFSVGPRALSDTSGGLLDRVWRIAQDNANGRAELYRANDAGGGYAFAGYLATAGDLVEVDLGFDQNGAPCVCAERAGGQVWLHWYNPALGNTVFEQVGLGRTPRVVLDDPEDPATAQLLLVYVSDVQGRLVYREQSGNFAVERLTPVVASANVYVEDLALLPSRRLQVFGTVRDPVAGTYAMGFLETTLYPYHPVEAFAAGAGLVDGYMRDVELLVYPLESMRAALGVPEGTLRENVVDLGLATTPRIANEAFAAPSQPAPANVLPAGADAEVASTVSTVYYLGSATTTVTLASLGLAAGDLVSVSLEVRSDLGTTQQMRATTRFLDAGGNSLAVRDSSLVSNTTAWTVSYFSSYAIPANAVAVRLAVIRGTLGAGDTWRRRRVMFNKGPHSGFSMPGAVLHHMVEAVKELGPTTTPRVDPEQLRAGTGVPSGDLAQVVLEYPERQPENMRAGANIISGELQNA